MHTQRVVNHAPNEGVARAFLWMLTDSSVAVQNTDTSRKSTQPEARARLPAGAIVPTRATLVAEITNECCACQFARCASRGPLREEQTPGWTESGACAIRSHSNWTSRMPCCCAMERLVTLAPKPLAVLCALARRPGNGCSTKTRTARRRLGPPVRHRLGAQDGHQRTCGRRSTTIRNSRVTSRRCRGADIASLPPRWARRRTARLPSSGTSRLGATIPPWDESCSNH